MKFAYEAPIALDVQWPELRITSVKHGTTEVHISDGRVLRLSFHIDRIGRNPSNPDGLDVSYSVISEVMAMPPVPIMDVHESIQ